MILDNWSKIKQFDNKSLTVCNSTDNLNKMIIANDFTNHNNTVVVCLPNLYQAQKYYDALVNLIGEEQCVFYPCDELATSEMIVSSMEFKLERINTIKDLVLDKKRVVVLSINGLLKYQLSKEKWKSAVISINDSLSIDCNKLAEALTINGYKRTYTVERVGEFSMRGNIFDVFPINNLKPIRIDFFGDDIESIKEFDINTQVSNGKIKEFIITPINELFYNDDEFALTKGKIDEFIKSNKMSIKEIDMFNSDINNLMNRNELDRLGKYIKFFSKNTIIDFITDPKLYIIDLNSCQRNYEKMISDVYEYVRILEGDSLLKMEYFAPIASVLLNRKYIEISKGDKGLSLNARETILYSGQYELLINDLKRKNTTFVLGLKDFKKEMIVNILKQNELTYNVGSIVKNKINIIDSDLLSFELYDDAIVYLGCDSIFSEKTNDARYKSVYGESKRIKSIEELSVGDYIVHYDYGIGKYNGIKTMDRDGLIRDYIHILYAGNDRLFVPIEKIDLIGKYGSTEGYIPKLNSLSSTRWEKTKEKVKKRVNDISDKLLKLYAEREASVGFGFDLDHPTQREFEADFPYEATIDQLKTIEDVKKDMESKRPMDRLICGDVGYGKTEIAMRGAFKAIMSGKQVAYLAPTTMLARQHYHTFKERFDKFGAKIALLNRFVLASKQNEIIKELKTGEVDVVIGTHRILSKDLVFKDLGLLIIDEEQRFGVEHKERIKEMKVNVDTITLTATPIPRTLQMAIMGIKDLSNLNTPPKNRYPVQTYVVARHDLIIKEAIERELARDGQAFYLYNKVDDIGEVASKIKKLVPECRVAFAHGQMDKYELETIIEDFILHKYDCLVCTTIIETGIDIPNTNTLIIHDSDRLGLSQLYQIRGRVGRSNKIAYAYLLYDGKKVLTETATKRLDAIKDFTELGSGFKIAMRDLAIRGAGDILGSDQSGFIDSVGIELYMKLLNENILEKQGKPVPSKVKEIGPVMSNRTIPLTYIEDDGVRIEIHKRINNIHSSRELRNLIIELKDRFGQYDAKLEYYMYEKLFKKLCGKVGIEKLNTTPTGIELLFTKKGTEALNVEKLFTESMVFKDKMNFAYTQNQLNISLDTIDMQESWLKMMTTYLESVLS